MQDEHHSSYYIPESSIWPIIGAIGLFFFAIGSLNFSSIWGSFAFFIGLITLVVMLFGWFGDVTHESHAGFYDVQMGRTFRWGMFWFLFCETFFFGTPLAALLYIRFSTVPWLAGQSTGGSLITHYLLWPNFQAAWPLVQNPNPLAFPAPKVAPTLWGLPIINTCILILSAVFFTLSLWLLKKGFRSLTFVALILTAALGVLFLIAQVHFLLFLADNGITFGSGIFGSLVFLLYSFHAIHIVAGLILLAIVTWLTVKEYFGEHRTFGFAASVLFWDFMTVVWLFIFGGIYVG